MVAINHFPKFAESMLEYGPGVLAAAAKHIEVVMHAVGHSSSIWRQGVIRDSTCFGRKLKAECAPRPRFQRPMVLQRGKADWKDGSTRKPVGDG